MRKRSFVLDGGIGGSNYVIVLSIASVILLSIPVQLNDELIIRGLSRVVEKLIPQLGVMARHRANPDSTLMLLSFVVLLAPVQFCYFMYSIKTEDVVMRLGKDRPVINRLHMLLASFSIVVVTIIFMAIETDIADEPTSRFERLLYPLLRYDVGYVAIFSVLTCGTMLVLVVAMKTLWGNPFRKDEKK